MAKFLSVAFALTFAAVATSAAASPINTFGIWTGTDSCAPCSGLGTNVFSDGFAAVNSFTNLFTFTGVSTDVGLGEIFVLGTLTFRNGQVSGNGNPVPTYFDLHIGTTSADAAFNQTIDLRVNHHCPQLRNLPPDLCTNAASERAAPHDHRPTAI